MKTAWKHQASIVYYTQMTEFIYRDGKAVGVKAKDRVSGKSYNVYVKHIVNAAGPWVDGVRQLDGSLHGKRLFLTKGVHLVMAKEKLPVNRSAYFDTPDGRMVFVIPRGNATYIGTTDTAYQLEIDQPRTTVEDRDYLLRAVLGWSDSERERQRSEVNKFFDTIHNLPASDEAIINQSIL